MKNKKYILIVIGIILLAVSVGISYAVWFLTDTQITNNFAGTACFDMEFTENSNEIIMQNTYPLKDEVGMSSTPYTFTVTNTCDLVGSVNINLEVLNTTTMDHSLVASMINNSVPKVLTLYNTTDATIEGATSYNLTSGYIGSGESVTYDLRLWVDYSATLDNSQNKIVNSKIVVVSTPVNVDESIYAADYTNVNEMVNDTALVSGDIVSTKGFYSAYDEGASKYEIVSSATPNEMNVITLNNGLYATLLEDEYVDSINVMQYGVKTGDDTYDSGPAIQLAFNSGSSLVNFPKGKDIYVETQVFFKGDKAVDTVYDGNDSIIYQMDEFNYTSSIYREFSWLVLEDDIVIKNFNFKSLRETIRPIVDSTSIGVALIAVINASNIDIVDTYIEGPDATYNEDGTSIKTYFVGIDLYSGWHNVLIDNVEIIIENDAGASLCFMARDILAKGPSGLVVENSYMKKTYHDEIFAIGMILPNADKTNAIEDIIIRNNEFYSEEGINTSSYVAISLSVHADDNYVRNVLFENNFIYTDASSSAIQTVGNHEDIVIRNNEINVVPNEGYEGDYDYVSSLFNNNSNVVSVTGNTINLIDNPSVDRYLLRVAVGDYSFVDNDVFIDNDATYIFQNMTNANDNRIEVTGDVGEIQRNSRNITGNVITAGSINTYSRYFSVTLDGEYNFNNNTITSINDRSTTSFLGMYNSITVNPGTVVNFNNNDVSITNLTSVQDYLVNIGFSVMYPDDFTVNFIGNTYPNTHSYIHNNMGDRNDFLVVN